MMRFYGFIGILLMTLNTQVSAEEEKQDIRKRLNLPNWLTIKFDHRTRYEGYDHSFRKGTEGDDQVLTFRTNVYLAIQSEHWYAGAELIDSRIALEGKNTPVNTTLVNQTELLQAFIAWKTHDFLSQGIKFDIKAGRQTMDVGSRRLIARNRFRNTINNFTGIDSLMGVDNRWSWRNFLLLPVSRLPRNQADLRQDQADFDQEDLDRILVGSFLSFQQIPLSSAAELYLFYLHEEDTEITSTKNRHLFTPGVRWLKTPKNGEVDFEFESVVQIGTSRASSATTDHQRLNHFAFFSHAAMGYTFDIPWQPRLIFQYDYASGDDDPNDKQNNRFETLFGARRFEFGPTSIWGAFARGNINSPGIRLQFKPIKNVSAFIAHRGYWLADDRDQWLGGNLHDKTGSSGSYIGQQTELRLRWKAIPKWLDIETGWAHLFKGEFAKNAPGSPANKQDSDYFYFQTSIHL